MKKTNSKKKEKPAFIPTSDAGRTLKLDRYRRVSAWPGKVGKKELIAIRWYNSKGKKLKNEGEQWAFLTPLAARATVHILEELDPETKLWTFATKVDKRNPKKPQTTVIRVR